MAVLYGSFLTVDELVGRALHAPKGQSDSAAIFAKDFSGLLLEKSAKTTRQPMPSAAPAVLLHAFYAQQGA